MGELTDTTDAEVRDSLQADLTGEAVDVTAANPRSPAGRPEKAADLKSMTHWHRRVLYEEVARRVLERHGPERICFDLAISRNTMRAILRTPEFKDIFEATRKRILDPVEAALRDERMSTQERVSHGAQRALSRLFHLLENAKSEAIQERAAGRILDKVIPDAKPAVVGGIDTLKIDDTTAQFLGTVLQAAVIRGHVLLPSSPSPVVTVDAPAGGADLDAHPDHQPPLFPTPAHPEP